MKPLVVKDSETKVESTKISPDEFLTTAELMRLLKIRHKQTIYNLIEQGMPHIKIGKCYRFIKGEVLEFFKSQSKINKIISGQTLE